MYSGPVLSDICAILQSLYIREAQIRSSLFPAPCDTDAEAPPALHVLAQSTLLMASTIPGASVIQLHDIDKNTSPKSIFPSADKRQSACNDTLMQICGQEQQDDQHDILRCPTCHIFAQSVVLHSINTESTITSACVAHCRKQVNDLQKALEAAHAEHMDYGFMQLQLQEHEFTSEQQGQVRPCLCPKYLHLTLTVNLCEACYSNLSVQGIDVRHVSML